MLHFGSNTTDRVPWSIERSRNVNCRRGVTYFRSIATKRPERSLTGGWPNGRAWAPPVDLLYGDHEDGRPTVTRFVVLPDEPEGWRCDVARHRSLDRGDLPRV